MIVEELELLVPRAGCGSSLLEHLREGVLARLPEPGLPLRLVVTGTTTDHFECEVAFLEAPSTEALSRETIFELRRRPYERTGAFNAVLLIPTGIGAEIGGHAGDGGPVARLLGAACDRLITHPNVANASDINELPANALYVEGSIISKLLMGTIGLQPVRSNRLLLVLEPHVDPMYVDATVNMVSAARAAAGIDCGEVVVLPRRFTMRSHYARSGRSVGRLEGLADFDAVLRERAGQFDAAAIASVIQVPARFHKDYFASADDEIVNPWGGVEAMLTHALSLLHHAPCAHAPMMTSRDVQQLDYGRVDPRKAAEPVSVTYLFSVLKGLHRSPRIVSLDSAQHDLGVITAADVSCLVVPVGCLGLPVLAALEQGIPVIEVSGNRNRMKNTLSDLPFVKGKHMVAANYLEAAGMMTALRAGVSRESVMRPIAPTAVTNL